ncbi:RDD family protein [Polaromonas sp. P2-4]|nr:RDD family protein [Polaromonas sp. P2-4]
MAIKSLKFSRYLPLQPLTPSGNKPIQSVVDETSTEKSNPNTSSPLIATFWPRFWARCIDLPLIWVFVSVVGIFGPNIRDLIPGGIGVAIDLIFWMTVLCIAVLLYDTIWIAMLGATPGKALFGLKVQSVDLRAPTTDEAFRRARSHLSSGLYFTIFFPVIQSLSAFNLWRNRNVSTSTVWDLRSRTFVQQLPIGYFRYLVAAMIAIVCISTMTIAHKMTKEITKSELRSLPIK